MNNPISALVACWLCSFGVLLAGCNCQSERQQKELIERLDRIERRLDTAMSDTQQDKAVALQRLKESMEDVNRLLYIVETGKDPSAPMPAPKPSPTPTVRK